MILRKYEESDKLNLIKFWGEVFPLRSAHNDPTFVLESKTKIDDLIFIAVKNGEIIGSCMAGYDGHRGWLYSVGVSPKVRRAGIGTKLMKYAIQQLTEIGCFKVNIQILSTNTSVVSFYESLGFAVEERVSMGVLTGEIA